MRRSRLAALALVAVFLTAACGLRANRADVAAAKRAALGSGTAAFGTGVASSEEAGAGPGGVSGPSDSRDPTMIISLYTIPGLVIE